MSMTIDDVRNVTVESLPDSPYKLALYYIQQQAISWDTHHRVIGEPQVKSFCASFEALLEYANLGPHEAHYQEGYVDGLRESHLSTLSEVRRIVEEMKNETESLKSMLEGYTDTVVHKYNIKTLDEFNSRLSELEAKG